MASNINDQSSNSEKSVTAILEQMASNGDAWHTAANEAQQSALHQANAALADQLASHGMSANYDAGSGTWTVTDLPASRTEQAGAQIQDALSASRNSARKQAENAIDYGTEQAVGNLTSALEDAQSGFQTAQAAANVQQARDQDAASLYAAVRGDNGGIGQSQYAAIANTGAQNRAAIQSAQVQAAAETARAIATLRAQGAYEKADAVLQTTQDYLEKLVQYEYWSAETNIDLDEWWASYQLDQAKIMGSYHGEETLASQQSAQEQAYQSAMAVLQSGASNLTNAQLTALGISREEALTMANHYTAQSSAAQKAQSNLYQSAWSLLKKGISALTSEQLSAAGITANQAREIAALYAQ